MAIIPLNPPELPALTGVISHGVKLPDVGLVYTAGQVAWDAEGNVVGDDLAEQFRKAYENIDRVLEAGGTSRDKIVKETIFLPGYTTDQAEALIGHLVEARTGHPAPPASTAVGVESLYADGFLVEIEVVAVI
ncbi:RidA family protein [Nocardia implantans]|uniref:RidA family protein n=1 Tax=Nocardia implantans TaxID=3108168 RepID=A0ABU6B4X0_9NOCA|nr:MULTISPECIES: RidA family protein [unclassified Nocardia]MBF6196180.1 RidA family protein [Nocardia beijingensis]MEA3532819.1 RidA family protein [Nocardia sp. CDC192]MEB3514691.1 RidA family protein [Nocardia sp. CDC186]